MNLLLCVAVLLYVVIKAECRPPVVIRRLPTLADFNLTEVPRQFEDRDIMKKHFVRVKVSHFCTTYPEKYMNVKTVNKTQVFFYEHNYFFDHYLQYDWMDENGNIDVMISGYDNILYPRLEIFYYLKIPCPTCEQGSQYISPVSSEEYSFDNQDDANNHPWTHHKTMLSSKSCEPPREHGYSDLQNQKYRPGFCNPLNCGCMC